MSEKLRMPEFIPDPIIKFDQPVINVLINAKTDLLGNDRAYSMIEYNEPETLRFLDSLVDDIGLADEEIDEFSDGFVLTAFAVYIQDGQAGEVIKEFNQTIARGFTNKLTFDLERLDEDELENLTIGKLDFTDPWEWYAYKRGTELMLDNRSLGRVWEEYQKTEENEVGVVDYTYLMGAVAAHDSLLAHINSVKYTEFHSQRA